MRLASRLILMIVASQVVVALAAAQQRKVQSAFPRPDRIELKGAEVRVPLRFLESRPVVEVKINGKGPYKFVLDTGAAGPVISPALVDELRPPILGENRVGSPGGGTPLMAKRVNIAEIAIGDAVISGVTAFSFEYADLFQRKAKDEDPPQGILSASLFPGFLITMDYPKEKLILRRGELPPADGQEVFAFDARKPLPTLTVTVADVPIEVYLDSAAPWGLALPMTRAEELPLSEKPVVVGKGRLVDREFKILASTLKGRLQLGRFTFDNPELRFYESGNELGTVGYQVLRNFSLTLDRTNGLFRLREAGAPDPDSRATGAATKSGSKSKSKMKKKR
jgi:hypothetical protein